MFANNSNYNVRPILYYDDINPHSRAVLMILNMLDVDIELRAVEMIKGEHLKPAYAKINPALTVPTMVHKDLIITGNAIFSYVCENNDNEKANQLIALKCYKRHCCVLSRLFFESQVLHRIHGHLMTDLVRKTIYQTDVDYHQKKVEHAYDVMEAYLSDSQFMAGSVLTAADISFVACLGALDMMFPIDGDRKRWEKLNDWYRRMRSLSIQKINEFGIEKQRQIVEYFAKFQFKSDIKRFTTGLRESQIPGFPSRPDRCSVSIQTVSGAEPTLDILSTKNNIGKITYLEEQPAMKVTDERNVTMQPNALKEGVAPKIVNEINKIAKTKINQILNEELEKELARFSEPNFLPPPIPEEPNPSKTSVTILKDMEKSVAYSETPKDEKPILTDRSLGGAHKERPPVPPKRKRYLLSKAENSQDLNNIAENSQKPDATEASEDTLNVFGNNDLCPVSDKPERIQANLAPMNESQEHKLSRLNGGVESTILLGNIKENEIRLQPPTADPLISANNSRETNKVSPKTSETIKIAKIINGPISSIGNLSEASPFIAACNSREPYKVSQKATIATKPNSRAKNHATMKLKAAEVLLPEGLPINGQQAALSYTRGAAAPNLLLPAPPPSPENYSQDEEFPPPPSELLIPKPKPRAKTTPNTRLVNSKPTVEPNERLGKKKSVKPKNGVVVESTVKLLRKKSGDLKSLPGRKSLASESKVCKLAQKLNSGGLFASGTRSPCSNRSQGSIVRGRGKKVPNTSNVSKAIQNFTADTKVSPNAKRLDKKIQKLKIDSVGTMVESSDSSTNIIQKLIGHSSKFSATKQLKVSNIGNQLRVEGGGHGTPSQAADGQNEFQQPTVIVVKSKTMMKMLDEHRYEERCQQKSPKSPKPRPKIPSNLVNKEMKPASQNFVARSKQKTYPTPTRFQTKNFKTVGSPQPTKFFDTSPSKPGQSFNKQQPKLVVEKKPTIKNKKKRGTKAHCDIMANKTASPLNEALSTPTSLLGTNASLQYTPEHATPTSAVGTVSSTLKTLTETIHISPKLTSPPTSNSDDTIIADVPVKVGMVAKALRTLNVANLNFRPPSYNISKELTSATPPLPLPPSYSITKELTSATPPLPPPSSYNISKALTTATPSLPPSPSYNDSKDLTSATPHPPPPPANHRHLAATSPSSLPVKDVLPRAGTIAKALQSLSAVTSEASPLCGTVKPFRKTDLKMKFMESARTSEVTDKALNNNITSNADEKIDARPLAEILTATVKQINKESSDDTKSTTLSEGIKEVLLKMQTLPEKNVMPVVIVNSMTESTKPFQSAVITPSTSVITDLKNSADKMIVQSESNNPLLTVQPSLNLGTLHESVVSPIVCEPVQVLVPTKKVSIAEPYDMAKAYPSWAARTEASILSASDVKSSKEEKNKLEASKNKRYVIDRTMINDGIVDMEPTPLPGQPNIIITGYTPMEPKNVAPLFVGTSRPIGNMIAPALRRPTNGPRTHGPSANVVISTFGYTPMSDLDTIPEHLIHMLNKPIYIEQQTAPPTPVFSAAAAPVTTVGEERTHVPRRKGDRPYPTAHRSGSQRRTDQSINIRGRVM
ncbi:uncharacterized protein LOC126755455 [Bactrocera neohumeralis]|uniref:uncharacterized protein LOC126755455 n=1 Tax=Bactrocera neohumeralis TaxID=98809 RepID=UPI002166160B|nr:uncharacterized protein LOC126755455 [Bactrocera neohumeralis]